MYCIRKLSNVPVSLQNSHLPVKYYVVIFTVYLLCFLLFHPSQEKYVSRPL